MSGMYSASRFEYLSGRVSVLRVARVGKGVSSPEALFKVLARELSFPDYFGENWNALIDCLSDLEWIAEDEAAIVHEALPALAPSDLRLYLESLIDVLVRKERGDTPRLRIVFQPEDLPKVEAALR